MSCRDIRSALHDYIEQALSETQRRQVEAHLETCADCRSELSDMKASLALTQDLDAVDPPPFLTTRVMARVRAATRKQSRISRIFLRPVRIPAGVLAAVTILLVTLSVYTVWTPFEQADRMPLISDNTSPRLPGDHTPPDQWKGFMEHLANHPVQGMNQGNPPDLQITIGVEAIDPNANVVLRRLLEMDGRILHIVADKNAYRITAEIDNKKRQALILFMGQIGQNMKMSGGLSSRESTCVDIVLLMQPEKP